ncbi:transketolase [Kibdelosporangium aridum]|uniref:Transketolase n=1 Tax=Kibdelosporangium aridum TaxID=2030 RepID=A0A428ZV20_KIBAR|nr:transketolase [Kibdelosporangium aridum]RSM91897.1 transketolase [Kibdelosporangium aridum]
MATTTAQPSQQEVEKLSELGQRLRVDAVRSAAAAGSGHPTSSMSAADLMAVLMARHLRYDYDDPANPGNDHLIFSKGHASPLYYAMLTAGGAITEDELMTYRKAGSRLEGHPTPRLPWVDVATGSLGQGLPVGVGVALAGKRLDRLAYRVWVLCGDSELAEGSMWEAFEHAGHEQLANLTAIVDVNRLGQRGPTRHQWDTAAYARRIGAFDWDTVEIDGHDIEQINLAYIEAQTNDRPTAIIAHTSKGKGVSEVENTEGAHGKPLPDAEDAIAELGGKRDSVTVNVPRPEHPSVPRQTAAQAPALPMYDQGKKVATRTAFGEALTAVGSTRDDVVVLDGEVADSTRTQYFADAHPDRFFEFYIAEQQMVAAAVGMHVRGWVPYLATFAAFLTRAYDFVRMAAVSNAKLCIAGSHAGVSIGEDGPSQMGLEDIAMMRAVHASTVLYPCDANQTAQLVSQMADCAGISYLRTTRGNTPVIYRPDERFPIGGSRVLRQSDHDKITIVTAGITVHEALSAADTLVAEGIDARVIDLYSVKPIDAATVKQAARETGCMLTVEDHWPQGGLGDAVLDVFADGTPGPPIRKLAVRSMPASATPAEQLRDAGINADAITTAARVLTRAVHGIQIVGEQP